MKQECLEHILGNIIADINDYIHGRSKICGFIYEDEYEYNLLISAFESLNFKWAVGSRTGEYIPIQKAERGNGVAIFINDEGRLQSLGGRRIYEYTILKLVKDYIYAEKEDNFYVADDTEVIDLIFN